MIIRMKYQKISQQKIDSEEIKYNKTKLNLLDVITNFVIRICDLINKKINTIYKLSRSFFLIF